MDKPEIRDYPEVEQFHKALDIIDKLTTMILFEFGRKTNSTQDIIIRNFIARGIICLKGIVNLWDIQDYHDCWILYRCILDRLFHLRALAKDNSYDDFEKWSYKKQYDSRNKVRSDELFNNRIDQAFFTATEQQKKRYDEISKEKIIWKRPKPEKIAREMEMLFLYTHGYDYASTLVHPMANDGDHDFHIQLDLPEKNLFPDQRSVLSNSFLVMKMLIQEGINNSTLKWREAVYNLLDNFMKFIEEDSQDWLYNMRNVILYFEEGSLSIK